MFSLRTVAITTALAAFGVTGFAQKPDGHYTQLPNAASAGNKSMPMDGSDAQMTRMDEQMKAMRAMHDKMMEAKAPEERSAMMEEHKEVMQNSMAMMSEMGAGGMMGKHRQMMEKRMQMIQSMMQMMMDHMPPVPGRA